MERYKEYLIEAKALGTDDHWEPRFAIHTADGSPTETLRYRALLVHEKAQTAAVEKAKAAAKWCIDKEL